MSALTAASTCAPKSCCGFELAGPEGRAYYAGRQRRRSLHEHGEVLPTPGARQRYFEIARDVARPRAPSDELIAVRTVIPTVADARVDAPGISGGQGSCHRHAYVLRPETVADFRWKPDTGFISFGVERR